MLQGMGGLVTSISAKDYAVNPVRSRVASRQRACSCGERHRFVSQDLIKVIDLLTTGDAKISQAGYEIVRTALAKVRRAPQADNAVLTRRHPGRRTWRRTRPLWSKTSRASRPVSTTASSRERCAAAESVSHDPDCAAPSRTASSARSSSREQRRARLGAIRARP